jgi:zona occludens toxin
MSITIVTGLPGSGKTLLTIDKLLRPLIGAVEKRKDHDGNVELIHRKIYTNIDRLVLEHESIEAGPVWEKVKDEWRQLPGNDRGLHNWHQWAAPGSVIIWDEVQRPWPPRPNGSPVPPDISALETHRHMGVDFIVMTQKPMLVDRNVLELADRHLHIRRMSTLGIAIVYEWDGVSRSLTYKSCLAKKPYRYNKKIFELYHSADLHTKQRRTLPTVLWALVFAGVAGAWLFPKAYGRITSLGDPNRGKVAAAGPAKAASAAASAPLVPLPLVPALPALPASMPALTPTYTKVEYSGCMVARSICRCFDNQGHSLERKADECMASAAPRPAAEILAGGDISDLPAPGGRPSPGSGDVEVIAWMHAARPLPLQAVIGVPSWMPPRDRGHVARPH